MDMPEITPETRAEASAKGVAARRTRAEAKRRLACGEVEVEELLESDDPAIKRMRVRELLMAFGGVGEVRASAAMADMGIAESRRIGGLGPLQRARISEFAKAHSAWIG